jgi:hypothetical protein
MCDLSLVEVLLFPPGSCFTTDVSELSELEPPTKPALRLLWSQASITWRVRTRNRRARERDSDVLVLIEISKNGHRRGVLEGDRLEGLDFIVIQRRNL